MKIRRILPAAFSIAALSLILASCGTTASTTTSSAPSSAAATETSDSQEQSSISRDTVTVSASATVTLVPDRAQFSVGVTTEGSTAEEAQQNNTTSVNSVIDVLKNAGVEERNIRTSSYSLSPRYDYSNDTQKINGYSAYCILTVDDQPVDTVGGLITQCVSAGATDVQNIQYYCSGYDTAYADALKKAVESAHTKAQALAEASGRELGDAVSISETSNSSTPYNTSVNFSAKTEGASQADLSVMPGETDIKAEISISYALK